MNQQQAIACQKGRGRPKQFNRVCALDSALDLFWRRGYQATSMADLVAATGAKAPTLYAEFGNKEGLFQAAVAHYVTKYAERDKALLDNPARTVAQAISDFLRATAAMFTDKSLPAGCFIVATSPARAVMASGQEEALHPCHYLQERMLAEFLAKRQLAGELAAHADTAQLAKYLACTLQGMSVQARDGASYQQLDNIISTLLHAWPHLADNGQ